MQYVILNIFETKVILKLFLGRRFSRVGGSISLFAGYNKNNNLVRKFAVNFQNNRLKINN
jgi:hypothetical protein